MTSIKNIEVFFIEYHFPKKLNPRHSGGLVENIIVGLLKITEKKN